MLIACWRRCSIPVTDVLFNTPAFLFAFLPLVVLVRTMRPARWRAAAVAVAIVVFIATFGAASVLAIVACLMIAWAGTRLWPARGATSAIAVAALGALLMLPKVATAANRAWLPVGLSFVALNLIGYVIDWRRGRIAAAPPVGQLATFATCFAYSASGPIVRWTPTAPQLRGGTTVDDQSAVRAALLIAAGLAKKTLIADPL